MTERKLSSVLWRGNKRAVMLGILLSLLVGRGYGLGKFVVLTMTTQTNNTATCGNSNGSVTVTAVLGGGTPPYKYSSDGGVTFQASPTFTGLAGGNYTIEVQDAATPTPNTGSVPVFMGNIPGPQIVSLTPAPASCLNNDGQVNVNLMGGTPTYMFSVAGPYSSTNPIVGLASGDQTIPVKDANGC